MQAGTHEETAQSMALLRTGRETVHNLALSLPQHVVHRRWVVRAED